MNSGGPLGPTNGLGPNPSNYSIILKSWSDWDEWINQIRIASQDAWPYLNPSTPTEQRPYLTKPEMPEKPNDPRRMVEYNIDWKRFKFQNSEYEKVAARISQIASLIQTTISRQYHQYLSTPDPLEMLLILDHRVAPSQRLREDSLEAGYGRVSNAKPNWRSIERWLSDWDASYTKCKMHALPCVEGVRPLYDFLNAVEPLSPHFVAYWKPQIRDKVLAEDKEPPDMYQLVRLYREHLATKFQMHQQQQQQQPRSHSAPPPPHPASGGHHPSSSGRSRHRKIPTPLPPEEI